MVGGHLELMAAILNVDIGYSSACVQLYKKFVWVLSGFMEILLRNIYKNLKTLKKIKL